MKYYLTIALLSLFAILSSCTEAQEKSSTEQLLKEINEAESQASKQDDQILFWKGMLQQNRYASDRVAKSKINYIIGKSFAPISLDSTDIYITKALILIEDVEGLENQKAEVYNGLGVIAQRRSKTFLSSFLKIYVLFSNKYIFLNEWGSN